MMSSRFGIGVVIFMCVYTAVTSDTGECPRWHQRVECPWNSTSVICRQTDTRDVCHGLRSLIGTQSPHDQRATIRYWLDWARGQVDTHIAHLWDLIGCSVPEDLSSTNVEPSIRCPFRTSLGDYGCDMDSVRNENWRETPITAMEAHDMALTAMTLLNDISTLDCNPYRQAPCVVTSMRDPLCAIRRNIPLSLPDHSCRMSSFLNRCPRSAKRSVTFRIRASLDFLYSARTILISLSNAEWSSVFGDR